MDLPPIGPAPVLAVLVGVFHTALYVLLRGAVGARLPLVLLAAILGAFAGEAVGARVGDPVRLGDFSLAWASLLAWVGIVVVGLTSLLGRQRTTR